ncbi:hypothetical protein [Paenibacillus sp. NPDC058071]|uniref:hypothetical protein n=1 Tax=Paenibacillus sp. NPDC058071 TaxID=3346326 RepID=UPI0036DD62C4
MSAKSKLTFANVKTMQRPKKQARISSGCACEKEERKHCDHKDRAVEAVQDAGKELSELFGQLKCEETAERLVRAIRCRDARTIQKIIGCDCRVVHFFCTHNSDCVKICCFFGRRGEVSVSFDICIKRKFDCCRGGW